MTAMNLMDELRMSQTKSSSKEEEEKTRKIKREKFA